MGLKRVEAAQLIQSKWNKELILALDECLHLADDFVYEFVGDWGVTTDAGLFVYRSYCPADVRRAFLRDHYPHTVVSAYTDGSGTSSDKPAGIGAVLYEPGRAPRMYAENIGPGTNNRAELCAVWRALRAVPDRHQRVTVYTDSEYAIGALTKDWARNANAELIQNIREDLDRRWVDTHERAVAFEHVDGHSGVPGNEVADRLSKIGRKLVTQVSPYEG